MHGHMLACRSIWMPRSYGCVRSGIHACMSYGCVRICMHGHALAPRSRARRRRRFRARRFRARRFARVKDDAEPSGRKHDLPRPRRGLGRGCDASGSPGLARKKFEKNLLDFMEQKYDLLLATTIIENGLDIPNANTIFIYNAQNFGLSDLHQMRGRVGRSNKKAFCYFITPEISAITNEAKKRINAIGQYSDLGSGFNIAMKDLEIRGAGDLLGGEQSGFINDIGFETYHKILNEAVEELKSCLLYTSDAADE